MPTHVRVLDGATRAELFAVDPFEAAFTGGVFVAAGDLNGDGVAGPGHHPGRGRRPAGPGLQRERVRARSPTSSGSTTRTSAAAPGRRSATSTATGSADLVVAAGFGGGPRVAAFDGAVARRPGDPVKLFADFFAFEQALRNGVFVAAGDLDGDGFADLIAGGGPGGGPRVTSFDGADLLANAQTRSADFFAGDPDNRGGIRVAVEGPRRRRPGRPGRRGRDRRRAAG